MNERIRELAEQAEFGWDDKYHWYVGSRQLEKFAELIVRECADFADEHNDASEGVTLGVGKAIKQHFGVEE